MWRIARQAFPQSRYLCISNITRGDNRPIKAKYHSDIEDGFLEEIEKEESLKMKNELFSGTNTRERVVPDVEKENTKKENTKKEPIQVMGTEQHLDVREKFIRGWGKGGQS